MLTCKLVHFTTDGQDCEVGNAADDMATFSILFFDMIWKINYINGTKIQPPRKNQSKPREGGIKKGHIF